MFINIFQISPLLGSSWEAYSGTWRFPDVVDMVADLEGTPNLVALLFVYANILVAVEFSSFDALNNWLHFLLRLSLFFNVYIVFSRLLGVQEAL